MGREDGRTGGGGGGVHRTVAKQQKPVSVLFFEKWDWGVKRFRITLIHDLTPHSPLVQPTTALSRVTVVGGVSLVWETHGEVVVFEQRRGETGSQIRNYSNGAIKKKGKGAEPKTNLAVK